MESKEDRINKAWKNYYSIGNSESMRHGNMICDKCGKNIRGNYLIKDRTNHMLRGNENDERYLFHKKCSLDNKIWVGFDKRIKEEKSEFKLKQSRINEVKSLIDQYGLEADDLFEINYYRY